MAKDLALADIRIDGGTQQRPIDDGVVSRYMALIRAGDDFPKNNPVDVVFDGKDHWLWDGFHRYHAYRKLGKNYIAASIDEGTQRDAIRCSFTANRDHGFPRQKGSIEAMLIDKIFPDEEWGGPEWTDEKLANFIGGITKHFIVRARKKYKDDLKKAAEAAAEEAKTAQKKKDESASDTSESTDDAKEEAKPVKDSLGKVVPKHLEEVFDRGGEIKDDITMLTKMFRKVKEAQADNDPLYRHCKLDQLKAAVANVKSNLRFTKPYAVCCYCCGDERNAECDACDGTGWLNETSYKAAPKEMKE